MKNLKKVILLALSLTIVASATLHSTEPNNHEPAIIHDDCDQGSADV